MSAGILDKQQVIQSVASAHRQIIAMGVKRIGLFGSFVRGEQNRESDIDFLVEFQPEKKNFDNFMQLACLLEDTFQRQIELVTPESISPYIRPYILAEVEYVPLAG